MDSSFYEPTQVPRFNAPAAGQGIQSIPYNANSSQIIAYDMNSNSGFSYNLIKPTDGGGGGAPAPDMSLFTLGICYNGSPANINVYIPKGTSPTLS